jgi:predicted transcriptional regulator
MPRIKPEEKIPLVPVTFKLRDDLNRKVTAYAKFLDDSSPSYVVAAALSHVLDLDKEFQQYLVAHPDALKSPAREKAAGRGRPRQLQVSGQ